MSKKVLYIIDSMHHSAGMERVVANKASFLSSYGYKVTILTLNQKGRPYYYDIPDTVKKCDIDINYDEYNDNIIIVKIFKYICKTILFKRRLSQFLFENPQDIVVTLSKRTISTLLKKPRNYKLIFEHHFNKFYDENSNSLFGHSGLSKFIYKNRTRKYLRLFRMVDKFVVLTKEDKALWGASYSNIAVIPNSIDYNDNEKANLDSNIVIAVGRLELQKGFDMLIKAWSLISNKNNKWELHIYGNGSQSDVLNKMIKDYNLDESIKIFPPSKSIKDKIRKASIFVLSSRYEGLPMVMLESMSLGLPCVSFNCKTGPSDIIEENGKEGILCTEGDIQQLADGLSMLMNNRMLLKSIGNNAHIKMKQYSHEVIAQQWIDLFENL